MRCKQLQCLKNEDIGLSSCSSAFAHDLFGPRNIQNNLSYKVALLLNWKVLFCYCLGNCSVMILWTSHLLCRTQVAGSWRPRLWMCFTFCLPDSFILNPWDSVGYCGKQSHMCFLKTGRYHLSSLLFCSLFFFCFVKPYFLGLFF